MYIADGDYIKDIEVNDLRNRYTLTKGSTQKMVITLVIPTDTPRHNAPEIFVIIFFAHVVPFLISNCGREFMLTQLK